MGKNKFRRCIKTIVLTIIAILIILLLTAVLFKLILDFGSYFSENYGDSKKGYSTLGVNDIIIYTVYVVQLVVTSILSIMVYRLSKTNEERVINNENIEKKSALKHIKNEINYNKSILEVLLIKNIEMNKVNKYLFKTQAWDTYSIVLVELLESRDYNAILSYYSIVQLYSVKELQGDVINTIKDIDEILEILKKAINKLG